MGVLIGHASIDENGKVSGGADGDQTKKEVCTRQWYNKPWGVLLRPAAEYAEKIAKACEAGCANDNIGYNQARRNTLHTLAKANGYNLSKVGACACDCSSFMTVCAIAGGITELEYTGNAPTTSTMRSKFSATNKFTVLTESCYLTSDQYLKRGDILVAPGKHTVMVLSNGSKAETTQTPTFDGRDVRAVSALNLNARLAPNGAILFKLNAGDYVHVVEENNSWCRIEAYVSNSYLVKTK